MSSVNIYALKSIKELRLMALERLKGNWVKSIFAALTFSVIIDIILSNGYFSGPNLYGALIALITVCSGAIALGVTAYFVKLIRAENPPYTTIFSGFKSFGRSFVLAIVKMLFTLLWCLLFCIPAIIIMVVYFVYIIDPAWITFDPVALTSTINYIPVGFVLVCLFSILSAIVPAIFVALRYSQAFYLLNDNAEMSGLASLKKSIEIMKGLKGRLFKLILSFYDIYIPIIILVGIIIHALSRLLPDIIGLFMLSFFNNMPGVSYGNLPNDAIQSLLNNMFSGDNLYWFISIILAALLIFIACLRLIPYLCAALACFYNDIKLNMGNIGNVPHIENVKLNEKVVEENKKETIDENLDVDSDVEPKDDTKK